MPLGRPRPGRRVRTLGTAGVSATTPAAGGRPSVAEGDLVEMRGEMAHVLARLAQRRLTARGEDSVLVDAPDEGLVEVRVLERQAGDIGQHEQGVGAAHRPTSCCLQGRARLTGTAAPVTVWNMWEGPSGRQSAEWLAGEQECFEQFSLASEPMSEQMFHPRSSRRLRRDVHRARTMSTALPTYSCLPDVVW